MDHSNTGLKLIASILIGSAILAFVGYTFLDATHVGQFQSENHSLTAVKTDYYGNLTYPSDSKPTIMQKKANGAYNGTVISYAKVTFPYLLKGHAQNVGRGIYADYVSGKDGAGGAYRNDTRYLQMNYTTRGAMVRTMLGPAVLLVALLSIVVTAALIIRNTKKGY